MTNPFEIGAVVSLTFRVEAEDLASFNGEVVHPVLGTFAIGRDAEWTCRQFVLAMKEPHEEAIGVSLTIDHVSPALQNSEVTYSAILQKVEGNKVVCNWFAKVGDRVIAKGEQIQKILDKEKLKILFSNL